MTGIGADQAWADLAFNPTNVPRQVDRADKRFMPLEPITREQSKTLHGLIGYNGIGEESLRIMFGEGFVSVDRLSKWAASWAIGVIREFEDRALDVELEVKSVIAHHYRTANPELRRVSVDD